MTIQTGKAYSALQVDKSQEDDDFFYIEGIASTPTPDRSNDIVVPKGAKFKTPMPLLNMHSHSEPIGHVTFAKPNRNGIPFKARLPKIKEAGKLKERIDEAIQSLKYKLIGFVSIGFKAEYEEVEFLDNGGIKFNVWEWLELSIVTIPANAEAVITSVKSFEEPLSKEVIRKLKSLDNEVIGAPAKNNHFAVAKISKSPGASGKAVKQTMKNLKPKEAKEMTIREQIEAFEEACREKFAAMNEIMEKSAETGETLDEADSEQYDSLTAEMAAIDKQIERLKTLEKVNVRAAKSVEDVTAGTKTVEPKGHAVARRVDKLEPGIAFARAAKCLALGHLEHRDATSIAKSLYPDSELIIRATERLVTKAAVAPATTTDSTWAKPLVGEEGSIFADFVEFLRPQTILGRFGQGGIPNLRRVPFRVPLIGQTSGGDGYWTGESKAKPLTKFDFSRTTLEPLKVANIAVATMEVIRDSSPSADFIIRDQLAAALRERMDIDFIDPAKSASAGVSPASVLNGVSAIPASGTGAADDIRTDIRAVFGAFIAGNNAPTSGVWIMSATVALALSLMQNPLGQAEFPGISMTGGTLFGLPVIVSEYVPSDTSGSVVAMVNAGDIYLGDEGGIDLSMSTEASLQMDDSPDEPSSTTTVMVSLWQRNLVGFRAERTVSWARRRTSAVAYLDGVNWGA